MSIYLEKEIAEYKTINQKSSDLHNSAKQFMPGGDSRNSIYWDPFPIYLSDGQGSIIIDVDGNKRVDFINNMTTLILGHRPKAVEESLMNQIKKGFSFPTPSPPVVRWAELMCERVPSIEKIRFVNSGTEATLNAIRAARAYTGKQKLAKFEGAYHGNHDAIQISVTPPLDLAGPASSPNSVRAFEGISNKAENDIVIMPFNDIEASSKIIEKNAGDLAAVIVEPVNGQCGMIPAKKAFLEGLRSLTKKHKIVLIFDEVISFRVAYGGAQEYYKIKPDLTSFGKIIGGGMPVGAFGGREDIMSLWNPSGSGPTVQHAGTFNGNPMTAVAGIATLESLTEDIYENLNKKGEYLRKTLSILFKEIEAPMTISGIASLFALQFTTEEVFDYRSYAKNNNTLMKTMFIGLLNEGYLLSNRCAGNISASHSCEEIDGFIEAIKNVLHRSGYG
ncbi:aspartate aminotransferase family protein [Dehalococcoidia bacterium]|nr:aspartate aminotransferase family protein [Dehalococcoidia bacterium]